MDNRISKNLDGRIGEILAILKHAINNNSATSNYIHDEDDMNFTQAAQAIKQLLIKARLDELYQRLSDLSWMVGYTNDAPYPVSERKLVKGRIKELEKELGE